MFDCSGGTFSLEKIGCRSHSPIVISGDDFCGSMSVSGDSLRISSALGTSIAVSVLFLLTNSTLPERGTSFLNAASDLMITSTSTLTISKLGENTGEDGGANGWRWWGYLRGWE